MKHLVSPVIVLVGFLMPYSAVAETALTPHPLDGRGVRSNVDRSGFGAEVEAHAITAWKRSLAPVAVSQALDISSSYGMRELNPLLAGPDGRFGPKAATIKVGVTAAAIGVEYLIVRKWPSSARIFSKLNWGSSILTGTFAAHNYRLR